MEIQIMLICGGGISSSFLCQNIQRAAEQRGIQAQVTAKSEMVATAKDAFDVVLVAPHLKYAEGRVRQLCADGRPYAFLDAAVYGTLNGDAALTMALTLAEKKTT